MASQYPTMVIDLPSKGLFYPKSHPLASGQIELKYMTAKEEDILSSANLFHRGVILSKLLESVIVTKVDINDLISGDKTAIHVATRIGGYGPEYKFTMNCPNCGAEVTKTVDLGEMEPKPLTFEPNHENNFTFECKASNHVITYKYLTHGDEEKIRKTLEQWETLAKKDTPSKDATTSYQHMITSVDGDTDPMRIQQFIQNEFRMLDSRKFKKHLETTQPDMDLVFDFTCDKCDYADRLNLPVGMDFFWPDL